MTNQLSVSFMFSHLNHGKVEMLKIIKYKILRWLVELSTFDIKYRPGPENVSADCLSRSQCAALSHNPAVSHHRTFEQIRIDLSHPDIVRLNHFVKNKNLPNSLESQFNAKLAANSNPDSSNLKILHLLSY